MTHADILAHITNGRTEAETARALSLSHTLAETEDMIRDGQEEIADAIAYFTAEGWYDVVAMLRTALLCVIARRGAT